MDKNFRFKCTFSCITSIKEGDIIKPVKLWHDPGKVLIGHDYRRSMPFTESDVAIDGRPSEYISKDGKKLLEIVRISNKR